MPSCERFANSPSTSPNGSRLVYGAIRGFGDPRSGKSPYNDWPSYDVVAQAMGGLMSITGQNRDHPMKTGPGIGDVFAGMMMAFAIVSAVRHVEKTGEGQFIDIAMYDAMISLCERMVYQFDVEGKVAEPSGNAARATPPAPRIASGRFLHPNQGVRFARR